MPESIIFVIVAIFSEVFAYFLIKKHKYSLIHSYHRMRVKKEDLNVYSEQVGRGISVFGFGAILSAALSFAKIEFSIAFMVFLLFFIVGMAVIIRAQKKYNGGVF